MKILLLNPPAQNKVVEHPDDKGDEFLESDDFGDFPPLGLLYVLSYLEQNTNGHYFKFIDCIGERITHDALRSHIEDYQPDIVGITSFTISLVDVCIVADTVKQVKAEAHVCMGGHHPIAFPFEAAQLPNFDSIIVGEGEIAFTQLVNAIESGNDFTEIQGVYTSKSIDRFRTAPQKDKRFLARITVPVAYVEDIDSLPPPNREYIKHIKYNNILGVTSDLATVLSSRGCPYLCTFCDVPYKRYRPRDNDLVLNEVQKCLDLGYKEIRFYDDLFNINHDKVMSFCEAIEKRDMKFVWDFRGRVNGVTYESLKRARKNGLRMISFGVETGTDEGLKILKKGTNTKKIRDAFEWCRKLGIITVADYIIGMPFEKNTSDIRQNINFLLGLDPDYAQVSILTLYPNTQMFDDGVAKGLVDEQRWRNWVLDPKPNFVVDHWTEFMNLPDLLSEQKKAYRRFYFRPKYILRSIWATRSLYEFWAKARGAMTLLETNRRKA